METVAGENSNLLYPSYFEINDPGKDLNIRLVYEEHRVFIRQWNDNHKEFNYIKINNKEDLNTLILYLQMIEGKME